MNAIASDCVVIAIDGPAGSGKSTAARTLARHLGYAYLDTGALYRAVAFAAQERAIAWDDEKALALMLSELCLELDQDDSGEAVVRIDGQFHKDTLRHNAISQGASVVSKQHAVRDALLHHQRAQTWTNQGLVADGRDMGTVVFPQAALKVFLTASIETRAQRRQADLETRGELFPLESIRADIEARDAQDSQRAIAPMKAARDAIIIHTDGKDAHQVVEVLRKLAFERLPSVALSQE